MEDSIFTKIIKGEIPCHKVYEDDNTIAFLDIAPYTAGHTLVVSKLQVDHLWDLQPELYAHLMNVVGRVAERQRKILKPIRVGMLLEGFAVPHAHVHVFPMNEGIEATIAHIIPVPTTQELAAMAKKLRIN
ncbi:MAG: HIT family protein [Patescibacteria group bacterium]